MNDLFINILRGSVSSVMNVILLFTLTKSKFGHRGIIVVSAIVFFINIVSTIWFYLYGDLTSLSRFNIVVFIAVGLALKPLTRVHFMQWCFNFLTILNIGMIIIVLSFHLSRFFPIPHYAHTLLRLVFYIIVIFLLQRFLLPSYRSISDNWPVFSLLVITMFLNLSFYFFVTHDIENTLVTYKWPLLLLVTFSLTAYGTVFYSLKKITMMYALETENLKILNDTELLHEAAAKLEKYANYDILTGLPNRRFFFEKLDKALAESRLNTMKTAILYIDLDGFKGINDTYGHEVGDGVLKTTGNRLLTCIRESDFAARLGGDEFAVVLPDIKSIENAQMLAKRIHTILQEEMHIDTVDCRLDSSIGIAIFPDTGNDSESLLRNGDCAMYEVKKKGKGGIGIYLDHHNISPDRPSVYSRSNT